MNELKKGDRFTSEFGSGIVTGVEFVVDAILDDGTRICADYSFLTRIPPHAERMQKVIDIAFDAENRLEDGETVQLKVGDLAAFARHYCNLRDAIESAKESTKLRIIAAQETLELTEKLLKGEA